MLMIGQRRSTQFLVRPHRQGNRYPSSREGASGSYRPLLEFIITPQWEPGTVVLWDNRVTAHSAIHDFDQTGARRHGARITPQAERPIPANPDLVVPDGPVEENEIKYRVY